MDLRVVSRTDWAAEHGQPDPDLRSYYVTSGEQLIGEFVDEAEAVAYVAAQEKPAATKASTKASAAAAHPPSAVEVPTLDAPAKLPGE